MLILRAGKPDPLFSPHLLVWRWLRRWCACGLRWKACQLRRNRRVLTAIARRDASARERRDNRPAWNALTVANPSVGRAGWLTPAQRWRANGGR
jgi:hypothetical protein